ISSIALPSTTNGSQRGPIRAGGALSVIPKPARALVQAQSTARGTPLLFPGTDKNLTRTPSTRRTACDARPQKASHEARFVLVVLGNLSSNLFNKDAFL